MMNCTAKLDKIGFELLKHLSYFPDLAMTIHYLF